MLVFNNVECGKPSLLIIGKYVCNHVIQRTEERIKVYYNPAIKIRYEINDPVPELKIKTNVSSGMIPLKVNFTTEITNVTVPKYIWNFDHGKENNLKIDSTDALPETIYKEPGTYMIYCRVTGSTGISCSDMIKIIALDDGRDT